MESPADLPPPETPSPAPAAAPAPAPAPAQAAVTADAAPPPRPAYEQTLERLGRELLHERRIERRWRGFFRMAWLLLAGSILWIVFVQRTHSTAPSGPHTALVEVRGEIAADTEASAEQLVGALRQAFEDSNAQAVVLRINSPG